MASDLLHLRDELIDLAHHLGDERRDYLIIGEGNVSARAGDGTMLIKASGSSLSALQPDQVVRVHIAPVLEALERDLSDAEVKRVLGTARVDAGRPAWPSIETFFHALLYALTDAQFIGHTHPTAVCAVLCSRNAKLIVRHIMPDVIVVCGREAVLVPYTDPGTPLAREIGRRVRAHQERYGESPRTIYLQNHGLIALGESVRQVQNVTAMAVKHARVLMGTFACGGPRFLDDVAIERIHSRPDEAVRRAQFK